MLWKYVYDAELNERTWFDVDLMLGVATDAEYRTQLSGLRTGQALLSIPEPYDEGDEAGEVEKGDEDEDEAPAPPPRGGRVWWWVAGGLIGLGLFLLLIRWRARANPS